MADKKTGFFKRLFRFGKKNDAEALQEVPDETSDTALGTPSDPAPIAHAEAASTVVTDEEAGADAGGDQPSGIVPIKDVPPPPDPREIERQEAEARAAENDKRIQKEEEERRRAEEAEKRRAAEEAERARKEAAERHEREEDARRQKAEEEAREQAEADKRAAAEKEREDAERRAREETERLAKKEKEEAERLERQEAEAAAAAKRAATESVEEEPKPDGVFEAPAETSTLVDVATPEPASDTPEPPVQPRNDSEPEQKPAKGRSWFARLKGGLARSSGQLTDSISSVFTQRTLDEDTLQDLEDVLIRADLGVETAMAITEKLADQRMGKDVSDEEVRALMAQEIEAVLEPVAQELELDLDHQPHVILVVGVNGSGKTTTIGKLSQKLYDAGFSTFLVAGDTFRAAAVEQLKIWGERTLSPVVYRALGSDAAGLAYDAWRQARDEGRDVVLMDTAGRLQNKAELMAELEKIIRVLKKHDPTAPHTVLLTLDATTGQNALNQVEIFKDVAGVNGLVMTKLDGTARGGIMVAIAAKYKLPVYFIGVGEQVDDLEPFEARDFARGIAGLS